MLIGENDILKDLIERVISVSDLSRGMASKVFEDVGTKKERFIVVKNNKPKAVIISIEDYLELVKGQKV